MPLKYRSALPKEPPSISCRSSQPVFPPNFIWLRIIACVLPPMPSKLTLRLEFHNIFLIVLDRGYSHFPQSPSFRFFALTRPILASKHRPVGHALRTLRVFRECHYI